MEQNRDKLWENTRQEFWYWLQDNPTTISELSRQLNMARQTVNNFIYDDGNRPDMTTIMRIRRFLDEKRAKRDLEIANNLELRSQDGCE